MRAGERKKNTGNFNSVLKLMFTDFYKLGKHSYGLSAAVPWALICLQRTDAPQQRSMSLNVFLKVSRWIYCIIEFLRQGNLNV